MILARSKKYKAMSGDIIARLKDYKDELTDAANGGANIQYSNVDIEGLMADRYIMLYNDMNAKLRYEFPFGDNI